MGRPVKEELRPLMPSEYQELQRMVQATSERVDTVRRAIALLSVAAGKSRTAAGQAAQVSRQAVTQVVKRFNQRDWQPSRLPLGVGASQPTRASSRHASWRKYSEHQIVKQTRRRRGR